MTAPLPTIESPEPPAGQSLGAAHGSASPVTDDAWDAYNRRACGTHYIAHKMREMEVRLRALIGVIEAHECTCFSCDRDGETYCDCLQKEAKLAKAMLTPNDKLRSGSLRPRRTNDFMDKLNAPMPSPPATGSASSITLRKGQELLLKIARQQKRIQELEAGLARIRSFPVHSEPVGGAYAMQEIAHETLTPNSVAMRQ